MPHLKGFFGPFFSKNALNFGLSRFFKIKIETFPALRPKTDGPPNYNSNIAKKIHFQKT
jgi:hypothetical protein